MKVDTIRPLDIRMGGFNQRNQRGNPGEQDTKEDKCKMRLMYDEGLMGAGLTYCTLKAVLIFSFKL